MAAFEMNSRKRDEWVRRARGHRDGVVIRSAPMRLQDPKGHNHLMRMITSDGDIIWLTRNDFSQGAQK